MTQNDPNHYLRAVSAHEVPTSLLLENAHKLKAVPEEEREVLREQLACEIEKKYPYMPGEDPALPGKPTAETAFTHPAYVNIRYAARRFSNKKDPLKMYALHAYLNIGDINQDIDSRYRMALAGRMTIGYCRDDEFDEDTYIHDSDHLDEYWAYLKKYLDEGNHLRIWYSNHPEELCGFYFLCSYLKKYDQEFYAVELPEIGDNKEKPEKEYSWSQMSEEEIQKAVKNARLLRKEEISANARIWGQLKKENAPLRAVINGQLVSVPEEFYDPWILCCVPADKPMKIKDIHSRIYDSLKTIGSGWLIHRIEKLIDAGKIELVRKHEHVWEDMIRLR